MGFQIKPLPNAVKCDEQYAKKMLDRVAMYHLVLPNCSTIIEGYRIYLDGEPIWERGTSNWHNLDQNFAFGVIVSLMACNHGRVEIVSILEVLTLQDAINNRRESYFGIHGGDLIQEIREAYGW
jgi:hypothetical protein